MEEFVKKYVNNIIQSSIRESIKHNNLPQKETNKDTKSIEDTIDEFANRLAENIVVRRTQQAVSSGKKILCVGIVCLDLITVCEEYPDEDSETLAVEHYWSRGGNASNSATVLAHLGACSEFFGTLVKNRWLDFLVEDFEQTGVAIGNCVFLEAYKHKAPVATLLLSRKDGTRTALPDFKGVTELTVKDFGRLNLNEYSWIHFEGRPKNPDLVKMVAKVNNYNETCLAVDKITISVEIEQPHSICPELIDLFPLADVILMSKDYATDAGYTNKTEAVKELYNRCRAGASLVCAWGKDGAAAFQGQEVVSAQALSPDEVVDTLGAGDTFNASVIYGMSQGASLKGSLQFACYVAGTKCGHRGFESAKGRQLKLCYYLK